ncbi:hypothetical protein MPSEU_000339600 [Mayamaea pseudoterrestris]|nr:hypothetical protein MPSEU_000339600 [Mayamaea pseudoterrestris]
MEKDNKLDLMVDELDDEQIWKPSFPPLCDFEEHLRCEICREFFNVPVSLVACKHTFCSVCIRTHLLSNGMSKSEFLVKPHCPSCNAEVETSGRDFCKAFYPNHQLQKIVSSFERMREGLKTVVSAKSNDLATANSELPAQDERAERCSARNVHAASAIAAADIGIDTINVQVFPSAHAKKSRRIYGNLKKEALRKVCRAEGLAIDGNDQELIERHKTFVTAWNAECDSLHPKSHAEIVSQLAVQERARRQSSWGKRSAKSALNASNPQMNKKLKHGFDKLIQEERERRAQVKSEEPTSSADSDGGNDNVKPAAHEIDEEFNKDYAESAARQDDVMEDAAATGDDKVHHDVDNGLIHDSDPTNLQVHSAVTAEDDAPCAPDHDAYSIASSSASEDDISVYEVSKENDDKGLSDRGDDNNIITPPQEPIQHSKSTYVKSSSTAKLRGRPSTYSLIGPWSCNACTFYNEKHTWRNAPCEVCRTLRTATKG